MKNTMQATGRKARKGTYGSEEMKRRSAVFDFQRSGGVSEEPGGGFSFIDFHLESDKNLEESRLGIVAFD